MKITKNQLKQIIKEELSSVLATEGLFDFFGGGKKEDPAKEEIPDAEFMNQLTEEDNTAAVFIHALHEDGIIDAENVFGITVKEYQTVPATIAMARARLSEDPAKQALFKNLLQLAAGTKRIEPKSGREEKYASKENVWVRAGGKRQPAEALYPVEPRNFKLDGADNIAPAIVDAMAKRHKEYKYNAVNAYYSRDRSKEQAQASSDAQQRLIDQGLVKRDGSGFTEKGEADYNKRFRQR
jgi:hypothetical protein